MVNLLGALNRLLSTLIGLVVLALLGAGTFLLYRGFLVDKWALGQAHEQLVQRDAQLKDQAAAIVRKEAENVQLRNDLERARTALRLMKVDHRVARIDVLGQTGSAKAGDLVTRFSFAELDARDQPIEKPRVFSIKGDLLYIDAQIIKYEDRLVEAGDPLRSTSVYVFRRLFGEAQAPKDGFALDPVGSAPARYRLSGKPSPLEQQIWSRFWEYANDPALASKAGVRAAHGEAPSIKLLPGKSYRVMLRSSAGLWIAPEGKPTAEPET
jgi:hypothetical protein